MCWDFRSDGAFMKARKKTTKRPPGRDASALHPGKAGAARGVVRGKFLPGKAEGPGREAPAPKPHRAAPRQGARLDSATLADAERFLKRHRSMFTRLAKL